jgi:hypothetical protein
MLCGSNLPHDCLSKTFKNTRVCQMSYGTSCCLITYRNAPCRTRTCDRRIRNPLLYPAELRALFYGLIRRSQPGNTERRQANGQGQAIQRAETRPQYLYRHNESGRYYVRAFRQGKEVAFTDAREIRGWLISDLAAASCARVTLNTGRKRSLNLHPPAGLEGLESPGRRSP